MWILWNVLEHLLYRFPPGDSFWVNSNEMNEWVKMKLFGEAKTLVHKISLMNILGTVWSVIFAKLNRFHSSYTTLKSMTLVRLQTVSWPVNSMLLNSEYRFWRITGFRLTHSSLISRTTWGFCRISAHILNRWSLRLSFAKPLTTFAKKLHLRFWPWS